ncbi:MAG: vitamin K epoxide reductase family protein [Thermoplasmata archaeon]|nr:vitamin K epoxide reductase family protein [Thermoplasmata archaeon]
MVDARVLHRALLAAILVGLSFSVYAGFEVASPSLANACSVNSFVSCGTVLHSGDTTFPPGSGVEDWYWGVAGFVALLALDLPLLRSYDPRLLQAVFVLSLLGLALAAVFAYVELEIVHALCPICLGAYLSGAAVVALSWTLWRMRRGAVPEPVPDGTPTST